MRRKRSNAMTQQQPNSPWSRPESEDETPTGPIQIPITPPAPEPTRYRNQPEYYHQSQYYSQPHMPIMPPPTKPEGFFGKHKVVLIPMLVITAVLLVVIGFLAVLASDDDEGVYDPPDTTFTHNPDSDDWDNPSKSKEPQKPVSPASTASVTLDNGVTWKMSVKQGHRSTTDPAILAKFVPQHDVKPLVAIAPDGVEWSTDNVNRTLVIAQTMTCDLLDTQEARLRVDTTLGDKAPTATLTTLNESVPAAFWTMKVNNGGQCAPIMAQEGDDLNYFQYLVQGGSSLN